MQAPVPGGVDARRVSVVFGGGRAHQRAADLRAHARRCGRASSVRRRAGPLRRAAARSRATGWSRWARATRRCLGRHRWAPAFGLRRLMIKDERRQPDRQLARPLLGASRCRRSRQPRASPWPRAGDETLCDVDGRLRRPCRAALGQSGRRRRGGRPRARDAIEGVGGRAVGVRSAARRAGRCWPTPSGSWAGGRSPTGHRRRSAATRWASRGTARSPSRSPSSCASGARPGGGAGRAGRRHPGHLARLPRPGRLGGGGRASRGWWRSRWAARWPARWPAARTGWRPAATCTPGPGRWPASPAPCRRCRRWSSRRAWWCG